MFFVRAKNNSLFILALFFFSHLCDPFLVSLKHPDDFSQLEMDGSILSSLESYDAKRSTIDLSATKLTAQDAFKCLVGEYNVIVPTPNARPCNNLDEYFYKSTVNVRRPKNDQNRSTSFMSTTTKKPAKPNEPFSVPLVRNFEKILRRSTPVGDASPSLLPTRPKKPKPDLFTRTNQIDTNSGPMSYLKGRLNNTVKVMIRRRKKVPYISRVIEYKGTLSMFDKHMNMYLKDVIETFKYELNGKLLKRGRHRDGIIVRGDNIILVA